MATPSYTVDRNWYTDIGAIDHLTSDLDRLIVHECYKGSYPVQVANGAGLLIAHIGQSTVIGSSRFLLLNNVLHVPQISKHLLYVHKLASDNDIFFEFHPNSFYVKDRAMK